MTRRLQRDYLHGARSPTQFGDRLLNAKATRRDEAQAVAASLRDFRLT